MVFDERDHQSQVTEFAGVDVDWYATDLAGQIGYFTSAGRCPIPASLSRVRDELPRMHEFFLRLPPTRSPELEIGGYFKPGNAPVAMSGTHADYRKRVLEMAQRGVFCFDAHPAGNPAYVRLIKPLAPMNIEELPDFPRALVSRVVLRCNFSEAEVLA